MAITKRKEMKKLIGNIFGILCSIVAFAGMTAATSSRLEFTIPFKFIVRNQIFPSGQYTVERLNPADPSVLILKNVDSKKKAIVQTRRIVKEGATGTPPLARGRDGQYFSIDLWETGLNTGYRIFLGKSE